MRLDAPGSIQRLACIAINCMQASHWIATAQLEIFSDLSFYSNEAHGETVHRAPVCYVAEKKNEFGFWIFFYVRRVPGERIA